MHAIPRAATSTANSSSTRSSASRHFPDPADGLNNYWEGLTYAKREVRDFMMSHIREYVEDYDFEGLEIDWLRDPHCLEPGATQQGIDLVTDYIAEIRVLTQARAKALRKRYPFGMRIPGNLGYLKSRGIDVPAICRRGLVELSQLQQSLANHLGYAIRRVTPAVRTGCRLLWRG